jgi:hypothetical protein
VIATATPQSWPSIGAVATVLAAVGAAFKPIKLVFGHIARTAVKALVPTAFATIQPILETVKPVLGFVGLRALFPTPIGFGAFETAFDPVRFPCRRTSMGWGGECQGGKPKASERNHEKAIIFGH